MLWKNITGKFYNYDMNLVIITVFAANKYMLQWNSALSNVEILILTFHDITNLLSYFALFVTKFYKYVSKFSTR